MVISPLGDHGAENCPVELKLRFPHILSTILAFILGKLTLLNPNP